MDEMEMDKPFLVFSRIRRSRLILVVTSLGAGYCVELFV